jgi:hypothetical protein
VFAAADGRDRVQVPTGKLGVAQVGNSPWRTGALACFPVTVSVC